MTQPADVAPELGSLAELRRAAAGCKGCGLWRRATQTVVGEGLRRARLLLVGEQPGDREDRQGRPFVGPAGALLARAFAEAGIDRDLVYVTNAVKHFKWKPAPRGKRRIHDKPSWTEIGACLPWLEAEIRLVEPALVVCLGATAAQAMLGRSFRVTRDRGRVLSRPSGPPVLATVHPSSVLRAPDDQARRAAYSSFVDDLRTARQAL